MHRATRRSLAFAATCIPTCLALAPGARAHGDFGRASSILVGWGKCGEAHCRWM